MGTGGWGGGGDWPALMAVWKGGGGLELARELG